MTTPDSVVGRTEAIGVSHVVTSTTNDPVLSRLDSISAAVGELKSRMDATDRRLGDPFVIPRPPPAPPFSLPTSFPVTCSTPQPQLTATMTSPQVTFPTSSAWIRSTTWPPSSMGNHLSSPFQQHSLPMSIPGYIPPQSSAPQYSRPSIGFSEPSVVQHSQPLTHPWFQDQLGLQPTGHTPLSRPQLINPFFLLGPSEHETAIRPIQSRSAAVQGSNGTTAFRWLGREQLDPECAVLL